jgi:hypothetical protein
MLFDSELDHYLAITPEQIRGAVERYLDSENRVILDIVPAALAGTIDETAPSASPQAPGEPMQPAAPAPQIPSQPQAQSTTDAAAVGGKSVSGQMELPEQTSDPVKTETGSGPLHT